MKRINWPVVIVMFSIVTLISSLVAILGDKGLSIVVGWIVSIIVGFLFAVCGFKVIKDEE